MLYCMPTTSVMLSVPCPQNICASKLLAFPFGQIDSESGRKETHTKVKTYLCNHLYQDESLRKVKYCSFIDIPSQILLTTQSKVKKLLLQRYYYHFDPHQNFSSICLLIPLLCIIMKLYNIDLHLRN